jgi:hypothetical protein
MSNFPTSQTYDLKTSTPQEQTEGMPVVDDFRLTKHVVERMDGRRIPVHAVQVVLAYGRRVWTRGAQVFALGRREVHRASLRGLDLLPYEGIQVVCTPGGSILTAYRNQDFKSLRKSSFKKNNACPASVAN